MSLSTSTWSCGDAGSGLIEEGKSAARPDQRVDTTTKELGGDEVGSETMRDDMMIYGSRLDERPIWRVDQEILGWRLRMNRFYVGLPKPNASTRSSKMRAAPAHANSTHHVPLSKGC
jgi:hypothetical protein